MSGPVKAPRKALPKAAKASAEARRAQACAEATEARQRELETAAAIGVSQVMLDSPRWVLIDRFDNYVHSNGAPLDEKSPDPRRLLYFHAARMAVQANPKRYMGTAFVPLTKAEREQGEAGVDDVTLAVGLWNRAGDRWAENLIENPGADMSDDEDDLCEDPKFDAYFAEEEALSGDKDDFDANWRRAKERVRRERAAAAQEDGQEAPGEPDPVELDWEHWDEDPDPVAFLIPGWLPDGVVTLFAAHGGTGKSYLSLLIALCLATGRNPFVPCEQVDPERIERVRVYLYSAEDNMAVLQFRLNRYMRLLGIKPADLKGWLKVVDATESNNVLFSAKRDVGERVTERMRWLKREVADFGAGLLVFDNASDAFDGNEIERAPVRQFLTALKGAAPAVLLLAHVDAASSMAEHSKAKGYSGSTGWHNSARSRWFMSRDAETDRILLTVPKSNYAKSGTEAEVGWDDGHKVFSVLEVRDGRAQAADHREVLLGLLAQVLDSSVRVSPAPTARNNLFKSLEPLDGFPKGLTSKGVNAELARWMQAGLVRVETYKKANRGEAEMLVLTEAGRERAARAPS